MASNEEHRYALAELYELIHSEVARIEAWMKAQKAESELEGEMRAKNTGSSGSSGSRELSGRTTEVELDDELLTEMVLEEEGQGLDLIGVRQRLRSKVSDLSRRLKSGLNEREAYHTLFPLVIHIDEQIRVATEGASEVWEPLQGELYEIDNGGELFYSVLEDLYQKAETHTLVFEAYYYALNDGFRGIHADNPELIQHEKSRLAARIPQPTIDKGDQRGTTQPLRTRPAALRYYAIAAVVVLVVYGVLRLAATLIVS